MMVTDHSLANNITRLAAAPQCVMRRPCGHDEMLYSATLKSAGVATVILFVVRCVVLV